MVTAEAIRGLRVLAADEDEQALEATAAALVDLGHSVTSFAVDVARVPGKVAAEDPDLAVVVVHEDVVHALDLIAEINAYASGPVIVLMDSEDPQFVGQAAERGVDAFARDGSAAALQSAIELAMRRHAEAARLASEVGELQGALDRRAVIERAKGILMERHRKDEREAFELLRGHARGRGRSVLDTARAILDGHGLLP